MPELPEIETVKLQLEKVLPGMTCVRCEVLKAKTMQGDKKVIEGKKVEGVRRIAKVLIIDLEDDLSLAFHFKMTGQLILVPHPNPSPASVEGNLYGELNNRVVGGHPTADFVGELPSKHTRVIFYFDGGTLYFNDQRLFGWVKIGDKFTINNLPFIKKLGPEPLEISEEQFTERIIKSKRPIKLVLMDQEILSGMGNIYANDALWEAGVDPKRKACSLTARQLTCLYKAAIKVLKEGIKYGGATAADAKYMDLHGMGGRYQEHFRVYDREGEECPRPGCRKKGKIIQKFALGGRGTYYCPGCQI